MSFELDLSYGPAPVDGSKYGIAVIGAGGIVEGAHLPAYRKAGLRVVGLYDQDVEKARRVAENFGIASVYRSLEALLEDPEVQIVDIAVPASVQPGLAKRIAASGRHMLCQKPLAETYAQG